MACAHARAADVPGHSGGSAPDLHPLPRSTTRYVPRHPILVGVTVNLTRIYTKLGDGGETDARVEAYGTVDELNAQLGVLLARDDDLPDGWREWLRRIQNDLFDVGADVSTPPGGERERLRVAATQTEWLEARCDEVNATLAPLRSFVIPGGTPVAAQLLVCRTVCRRAKRRAVAVGDELNAEIVRYLNRLSDLLFILARAANRGAEPLWEPGAGREDA